MIAKITPSPLCGTATAPPSKSMAHRHLICAALAEGKSIVHGIADSEDIKATIGALRGLGCKISVENETAVVEGICPSDFAGGAELFVNESGSTLRFMIPICLLSEKKTRLCGKARLFERPLHIYEDICHRQGLSWERGHCELTVGGALRPEEYAIPGNISSQFISGLLFALPLLGEDSTIRITETFESVPYILMTLQVLEEHGISVEFDGAGTFRIPGNQRYTVGEYTVEGDYSNAAFFDALTLLGHKVRTVGLTEDSLQGDRIYRDYFAQLASGTPALPIGDCPDLAPILMAVAAEQNGCTLTETERLRIKESDRGAVMAEELSKFGAKVQLHDHFIVVEKSPLKPPTEPLMSHGDHRVVMSLAVLATKYGGTIHGAQDVNKSFPDFFRKMTSLDAEVELYETEQK